MQAKILLQLIKENQPPVVVDVRSGGEFSSGHISGAVHVPAWKIALRIGNLPKDKDCQLVVTCEHGPRAQAAKGLLNSAGYHNVELLDGHMSGWRAAGLPVEK